MKLVQSEKSFKRIIEHILSRELADGSMYFGKSEKESKWYEQPFYVYQEGLFTIPRLRGEIKIDGSINRVVWATSDNRAPQASSAQRGVTVFTFLSDGLLILEERRRIFFSFIPSLDFHEDIDDRLRQILQR